VRGWGLLLVTPGGDGCRAERHPLAVRLPSPSVRFSCDFNILRQKFTDSTRRLQYSRVVHAVWRALLFGVLTRETRGRGPMIVRATSQKRISIGE
jgi:hypothetical protein